jgi:hypothetical protein
MSFEPHKVEDFLLFLKQLNCKLQHLMVAKALFYDRDAQLPNVLCTYSYWQSEMHLNKYRYSPLFKDTWTKNQVECLTIKPKLGA